MTDKLKWQRLAAIPREKRLKILLIVGLAAILGIFMSESFTTKNKNSSDDSLKTQSIVLEEYEQKTEKRLQSILEKIEGIGSCYVMVTAQSSEQNIYSSDVENTSETSTQNTSSSEKNTHVIVDDNGEQPVLEQRLQPKLRGVIVVCEGADDVNVREAVTLSVMASLGVSSSNISVVKGGNHD